MMGSMLSQGAKVEPWIVESMVNWSQVLKDDVVGNYLLKPFFRLQKNIFELSLADA